MTFEKFLRNFNENPIKFFSHKYLFGLIKLFLEFFWKNKSINFNFKYYFSKVIWIIVKKLEKKVIFFYFE